jgi:hypothetical protein
VESPAPDGTGVRGSTEPCRGRVGVPPCVISERAAARTMTRRPGGDACIWYVERIEMQPESAF